MGSRMDDAIDSALALVAFSQNNVAHADTKIGVLCVAQVGFALASVNSAWITGEGPVPVVLPVAACTVAFLASGYHIAQALRPRLRFHRDGWLGMGAPCPGPRKPLTAEEAWQMAELLAEIARTKNEHIRRAVPWVAVMLTVIVASGLSEKVLG